VKVATFTVRSSAEQSVRWKSAASADGHLAVGTWLAEVADANLKPRIDAGRPIPLAWHRGRLQVRLADGGTVEVKGWRSPPFGIFHGDAAKPRAARGRQCYSLCKALAGQLAHGYLREEAAAALGIGARQDGTRGEEVGMA
jgi:hypothetical protein